MMDKKTVTESLRALAKDDNKRSKAARLRDVIDDVEAALSAGVPRSAVVEALSKHGLQMSLTTFETTLRRIRQKRGRTINHTAQPAGQQARPVKPSVPVPSVQASETSEAFKAPSSHDPQDINRIMASTPDLDALAKIGRRNKK